jgi:hypothetical protein
LEIMCLRHARSLPEQWFANRRLNETRSAAPAAVAWKSDGDPRRWLQQLCVQPPPYRIRELS